MWGEHWSLIFVLTCLVKISSIQFGEATLTLFLLLKEWGLRLHFRSTPLTSPWKFFIWSWTGAFVPFQFAPIFNFSFHLRFRYWLNPPSPKRYTPTLSRFEYFNFILPNLNWKLTTTSLFSRRCDFFLFSQFLLFPNSLVKTVRLYLYLYHPHILQDISQDKRFGTKS